MTDTDPPDLAGTPGRARFLVLYGSHAHGTNTPTSDIDWRGVYQLPTDAFLDLDVPKTTFERKDDDFVMWELAHFCRLILKGNPNIVGMLFAPHEYIARLEWPVQQLVNARRRFITQRMVSAYRGWVHLELRQGEALTGKRASHLLRLLWELQGAVVDGEIPVRLPDPKRETIIAVKTGEITVPEALNLIHAEVTKTDIAIDGWTPMPDPTDYVRQVLIEARHRELGLS